MNLKSMQVLRENFKNTGNLHHAYCLVGARDVVRDELHTFLDDELKIVVQGNPDVWNFVGDSLSIDESRALKIAHTDRAFAVGGKRIFIISINTMGHEAQNSLLKVLEEPVDGSHFFFILPTSEALLPTLRSRMVVITHESFGVGDSQSNLSQSARDFIKSPLSARLEFVKATAEKVSDGAETRAQVADFISCLERELYALSKKKATEAKALSALKEVLLAKKYINDRSSSVKMLLEHIALALS
jgi:DNA polymerase III delta prime subunit